MEMLACSRHLAARAHEPDQRRTLLTQLNWRYAVKQFDPTRKISPEDWATLENALILSPSSYGLQPWTLIHIV
jgi:nitroreductase